MQYKIQIVDLNNNYYGFNVNKFSSVDHFTLCPQIKSCYKYASDAYKDAKNMVKKYS